MTRNQRLILSGLALAVAFALGFVLRGPGSGGAADPHAGHDHGPAAAAEPTVWTCSMHPQFQLPSPGECPICFMDLIPLEEDGQEGLGPRDLVLSESAVALAEIRILCKQLFISSLKERRGKVEVTFSKVAKVSVDRILHVIATGGNTVRLDPNRPNTLILDTTAVGLREKSEFLRGRLSALV